MEEVNQKHKQVQIHFSQLLGFGPGQNLLPDKKLVGGPWENLSNVPAMISKGAQKQNKAFL